MAESHILWCVRYYPWHDGVSCRPMGIFKTREEAEKRFEEIKVEMNETWATPDPDGLRIEPVNFDNKAAFIKRELREELDLDF